MCRMLRLSEPQNHRCCYCGHFMIHYQNANGIPVPRNALTRDHIIARSYGGKNGDNLVAACSLCNQLRGNMQAVTFFNLVQKWFSQDPTLRNRWHQIEPHEMYQFRLECLQAHERHLHRRGVQSVEHAFRHLKLLQDFGYQLQAR